MLLHAADRRAPRYSMILDWAAPKAPSVQCKNVFHLTVPLLISDFAFV
jgi:hypothetical protein